MMELAEVLAQLQSYADPAHKAEMARVGINLQNALGVDIYTLRKLAKPLRPDHDLALGLWESGIHEARVLASMVDDPAQATEAQLEAWAADFDSWDVCDQVCDNLFQHTAFAYPKAFEWSGRSQEFVKRAGFVLMCCLAFYDRESPDTRLAQFFPIIVQASDDERNYVKKAVNWALRNLGKHSLALNAQAVAVAREIQARGTRPGRWIAADALRELTSEKMQARLKKRSPSW
jgi:3-methyladenine DNA glycosylase AlkD